MDPGTYTPIVNYNYATSIAAALYDDRVSGTVALWCSPGIYIKPTAEQTDDLIKVLSAQTGLSTTRVPSEHYQTLTN